MDNLPAKPDEYDCTDVAQVAKKRYGITDEDRAAVADAMKQQALSGGMGSAMAGEVFRKMDESALKEAEFNDKKQRLDAGKPTEIIGTADELALRIGRLQTQLPKRVGDRSEKNHTPRVRLAGGGEADVVVEIDNQGREVTNQESNRRGGESPIEFPD